MTERDVQIKNSSGWFERAALIVLERAGCGSVYVTQQEARLKLPASRVDCIFVQGPRTEVSVNDEGDEIPDALMGRLIYTLYTKREQTQAMLIEGVRTLHEDWAARIRASHDFKENPFGGLLPFHTVLNLGEGQNDRDLDLNFWVDYTRIPIDVQFGVNHNAWSITAAQVAAFAQIS